VILLNIWILYIKKGLAGYLLRGFFRNASSCSTRVTLNIPSTLLFTIPGVSLKILIRLNEPIDFLCKVRSRNENPLFLRFKASAVTLSGSQLGNTCPFPALKAGLSPSCSPRWVPHCSQRIFAQKQWVSLKTKETPVTIPVDLWGKYWYSEFLDFNSTLCLRII